MQAAYLTAPRTFSINKAESPCLAKGEARVRVRYAGVCGSDLHFYKDGRIGDAVLDEPFIMGHEFGGMIEDTNGIQSCPPKGTRVAVEPATPCGTCPFCRNNRPNICPNVRFTGFPPYQGAFAELISVPLENLYPLPDTIPDKTAPLLETLAVALHGLELVPDVKGKQCAVLGAGPVGLLTLMELKRRGAGAVFVIEPIAERRELAKQMGARYVFDPADTGSIKECSTRETGYGPELVFEAVGEPESFQMAFDLPRPGGMTCLFGIYPGDSFPIDFNQARRKELAVIFVRRSLPKNYPEAIRLVSEGELDVSPLLTHTFPLSQISDAFETALARRDGVVKVTIKI